MNVNDIIHRALMAGIGVPEKMKELIDELVQKGELSESQGARLVRECSDKIGKSTDEAGKSLSDFFHKSMEKMNLPTREEIETLERKVATLSSKVKKLEEALRQRGQEK